jgi:hypothetical protein
VERDDMIAERRAIGDDEIDVVRVALERACIGDVTQAAKAAISKLEIIARCECGCASVDFNSPASEERSKPIADATAKTPRGGDVGVLVWGRHDAVTGLEIYDLGAGDGDLVLPIPESIIPWGPTGTERGDETQR